MKMKTSLPTNTTAIYWLIWSKACADQAPKNNNQTDQTYYAQGYRRACNDIAKQLAEKLDELQGGL